MLKVGAALISWEYDWKRAGFWAQSAEVQAKPGTGKMLKPRRGLGDTEEREAEDEQENGKKEEKRGLDILD